MVWLCGFIRFAQTIPTAPSDLTTRTDAIVVLTGGSNRLNAALELLDDNKGEKLLISGMGKGITLENLKQLDELPHGHISALEDRIILGYIAENTRGNAEETAIWMQLEEYKTIRLVTANYHIPRSILEFSTIMPEIAIIPHPVNPDNVNVVQ